MASGMDMLRSRVDRNVDGHKDALEWAQGLTSLFRSATSHPQQQRCEVCRGDLGSVYFVCRFSNRTQRQRAVLIHVSMCAQCMLRSRWTKKKKFSAMVLVRADAVSLHRLDGAPKPCSRPPAQTSKSEKVAFCPRWQSGGNHSRVLYCPQCSHTNCMSCVVAVTPQSPRCKHTWYLLSPTGVEGTSSESKRGEGGSEPQSERKRTPDVMRTVHTRRKSEEEVLSVEATREESQRDGEMQKNDRVERVRQEVLDQRSTMEASMQQVLSRGERIEDLEERSSHLEESALNFNRSAKKSSRGMLGWFKNLFAKKPKVADQSMSSERTPERVQVERKKVPPHPKMELRDESSDDEEEELVGAVAPSFGGASDAKPTPTAGTAVFDGFSGAVPEPEPEEAVFDVQRDVRVQRKQDFRLEHVRRSSPRNQLSSDRHPVKKKRKKKKTKRRSKATVDDDVFDTPEEIMQVTTSRLRKKGGRESDKLEELAERRPKGFVSRETRHGVSRGRGRRPRSSSIRANKKSQHIAPSKRSRRAKPSDASSDGLFPFQRQDSLSLGSDQSDSAEPVVEETNELFPAMGAPGGEADDDEVEARLGASEDVRAAVPPPPSDAPSVVSAMRDQSGVPSSSYAGLLDQVRSGRSLRKVSHSAENEQPPDSSSARSPDAMNQLTASLLVRRRAIGGAVDSSSDGGWGSSGGELDAGGGGGGVDRGGATGGDMVGSSGEQAEENYAHGLISELSKLNDISEQINVVQDEAAPIDMDDFASADNDAVNSISMNSRRSSGSSLESSDTDVTASMPAEDADDDNFNVFLYAKPQSVLDADRRVVSQLQQDVDKADKDTYTSADLDQKLEDTHISADLDKDSETYTLTKLDAGLVSAEGREEGDLDDLRAERAFEDSSSSSSSSSSSDSDDEWTAKQEKIRRLEDDSDEESGSSLTEGGSDGAENADASQDLEEADDDFDVSASGGDGASEKEAGEDYSDDDSTSSAGAEGYGDEAGDMWFAGSSPKVQPAASASTTTTTTTTATATTTTTTATALPARVPVAPTPPSQPSLSFSRAAAAVSRAPGAPTPPQAPAPPSAGGSPPPPPPGERSASPASVPAAPTAPKAPTAPTASRFTRGKKHGGVRKGADRVTGVRGRDRDSKGKPRTRRSLDVKKAKERQAKERQRAESKIDDKPRTPASDKTPRKPAAAAGKPAVTKPSAKPTVTKPKPRPRKAVVDQVKFSVFGPPAVVPKKVFQLFLWSYHIRDRMKMLTKVKRQFSHASTEAGVSQDHVRIARGTRVAAQWVFGDKAVRCVCDQCRRGLNGKGRSCSLEFEWTGNISHVLWSLLYDKEIEDEVVFSGVLEVSVKGVVVCEISARVLVSSESRMRIRHTQLKAALKTMFTKGVALQGKEPTPSAPAASKGAALYRSLDQFHQDYLNWLPIVGAGSYVSTSGKDRFLNDFSPAADRSFTSLLTVYRQLHKATAGGRGPVGGGKVSGVYKSGAPVGAGAGEDGGRVLGDCKQTAEDHPSSAGGYEEVDPQHLSSAQSKADGGCAVLTTLRQPAPDLTRSTGVDPSSSSEDISDDGGPGGYMAVGDADLQSKASLVNTVSQPVVSTRSTTGSSAGPGTALPAQGGAAGTDYMEMDESHLVSVGGASHTRRDSVLVPGSTTVTRGPDSGPHGASHSDNNGIDSDGPTSYESPSSDHLLSSQPADERGLDDPQEAVVTSTRYISSVLGVYAPSEQPQVRAFVKSLQRSCPGLTFDLSWFMPPSDQERNDELRGLGRAGGVTRGVGQPVESHDRGQTAVQSVNSSDSSSPSSTSALSPTTSLASPDTLPQDAIGGRLRRLLAADVSTITARYDRAQLFWTRQAASDRYVRVAARCLFDRLVADQTDQRDQTGPEAAAVSDIADDLPLAFLNFCKLSMDTPLPIWYSKRVRRLHGWLDDGVAQTLAVAPAADAQPQSSPPHQEGKMGVSAAAGGQPSWQLDEGSIVFVRAIGEGHFGVVYKCVLACSKHRPGTSLSEQKVATLSPSQERKYVQCPGCSVAVVKRVSLGTHVAHKLRPETILHLVTEATTNATVGMKEKHSAQMYTAVVPFRGVCVNQRSEMWLATDLMEGGDMLKHLRQIAPYYKRHVGKRPAATRPTKATLAFRRLTWPQQVCHLVRLCLQAAIGVAYMHRRRFVHRDIAARNFLLDKQGNAYISDFGLTRKLPKGMPHIAIREKGGLPWRWMAPETLAISATYNFKADVWSVGCLIWEVFAGGKAPYSNIMQVSSYVKLAGYLEHGGALKCEDFWPQEVKQLIGECCALRQSGRPSMEQVVARLAAILVATREQAQQK